MARAVPSLITPSLHGSAGNVTFVRTVRGVDVRNRPTPRDPASPAQLARRVALARVSRAWTGLTVDQAQAWSVAARALQEASGGLLIGPVATGQALFTRLGLKLLQIDPGRELPLAPPTVPFTGDRVRVTAGPVQGGVRFTADAPTSPGVVAELLTQRLASIHRTPYAERYRSRAFSGFDVPDRSVTVAATPGVVATALRLVDSATGQTLPLVPLSLVLVTG